jgi:hypothetical protein
MPCAVCGGPLPPREPTYCGDPCRVEADEAKQRSAAIAARFAEWQSEQSRPEPEPDPPEQRIPPRPEPYTGYSGHAHEQRRRQIVAWDAKYGPGAGRDSDGR